MGSRLTDEEREECAQLKKLFAARAGMSQKAFASAYGLGNQSNVSHYLNAHQPITLEAATRFAKGLEVSVEEFSPRLARMARSMANAASIPSGENRQGNVASSQSLTPIVEGGGSRNAHHSSNRPVTKLRRAPIVQWGQMGANVSSVTDSADVVSGELSVPLDLSPETVVWQVRDDSMSPDYNPGDYIALDSAPDVISTIRPGEAVIVETSGGTQMLRYYTPLADGHFEARPPALSRYGALSTLQMPLRVCAVVLAHLRVRQRPPSQSRA